MDPLREIDAPALVEQVIAVPKISMDRVPQRSVCRRSRRAEQLVEVPTIISYSSLQRTVEQTIDIPVPHDRCGRAVVEAFKAFLQDRALQRTVEQILLTSQFQVAEGETSVFKVFLPDSSTAHLVSHERSSERIVEQIVEIPVSRGFDGGLQDFRPGQGPTASSDFLASSSVSPGHAGEGVFRTFPQNKKSPNSPASQSSGLLGEVNPMDAGGLWRPHGG